jgi:HD superfamily phosphodiesterase
MPERINDDGEVLTIGQHTRDAATRLANIRQTAESLDRECAKLAELKEQLKQQKSTVELLGLELRRLSSGGDPGLFDETREE